MTERLYYENSFLYDFVAALSEVRRLEDGRSAAILDRTAFYPTSGGQTFDTGWIELQDLDAPQAHGAKLRVAEVIEDEASGEILHVVEQLPGENASLAANPGQAVRVRGFIDVERRRDHIQQHSGQHVLSAAFIELFDMPTVSFHMGDESCTIDLDAKALTEAQARQAEERANEIIFEDRPFSVQFVTPDEARGMGLRKLPPEGHEKLRLVGIAGDAVPGSKAYDLCGCGGTHVRSAGQIGAILLRKLEKVKQGVRVEFYCGQRAVGRSHREYVVLTESAGLYSAHEWTLAEQIRKSLEELKASGKREHRLLEEVAELRAAALLNEAETVNGTRLVALVVADREPAFVKMLAQKLAASCTPTDRSPLGTPQPATVALLACEGAQPTLVFAQSKGGPFDMGGLMKQEMTRLGSRGGGSRELAQGGVPDVSKVREAIKRAKAAVISAAPAPK